MLKSMKTLSTVALGGALLLGLNSCTVTTQANVGLAGSRHNLIADLQPTKGEGSGYRVGENIAVRVTTRTDGYITLLALDPNGTGNVLVQNAFVRAGTTVFPRPEDGVNYTVVPPLGTERIRAIFTRVRPTTSVVLSGQYDAGRWNDATNAYLTPYSAADRDIQETYLFITR